MLQVHHETSHGVVLAIGQPRQSIQIPTAFLKGPKHSGPGGRKCHLVQFSLELVLYHSLTPGRLSAQEIFFSHPNIFNVCALCELRVKILGVVSHPCGLYQLSGQIIFQKVIYRLLAWSATGEHASHAVGMALLILQRLWRLVTPGVALSPSEVHPVCLCLMPPLGSCLEILFLQNYVDVFSIQAVGFQGLLEAA